MSNVLSLQKAKLAVVCSNSGQLSYFLLQWIFQRKKSFFYFHKPKNLGYKKDIVYYVVNQEKMFLFKHKFTMKPIQ